MGDDELMTTEKSTKERTIYDELVDVNKSITKIVKSGQNKSYDNFKYAPIEDVYDVCRNALADNGVLLTTEIVENEVQRTTTTQNKNINYAYIVTNYVFHKGAEKTEAYRWVGEAMDTGDKSYSKAVSYAQKTFLCTFFNIPRVEAGGDPDETSHDAPAQPHTQAKKPYVHRPENTYMLKLFGKQLNWMLRESPYENKRLFNDVCKRMGVKNMIMDWSNGDCAIVSAMIADVSGITVNYKQELSADEVAKIDKALRESMKAWQYKMSKEANNE
jgi:hypothetical protein